MAFWFRNGKERIESFLFTSQESERSEKYAGLDGQAFGRITLLRGLKKSTDESII